MIHDRSETGLWYPGDHLRAATILFHDDTATPNDLLQREHGKKEKVRVKKRERERDKLASGSLGWFFGWKAACSHAIVRQSGIESSPGRELSASELPPTRDYALRWEFDSGIYVAPTNFIRLRWQACLARPGTPVNHGTSQASTRHSRYPSFSVSRTQSRA